MVRIKMGKVVSGYTANRRRVSSFYCFCALAHSVADTPAAPFPRVGRPKGGSAHTGNVEA